MLPTYAIGPVIQPGSIPKVWPIICVETQEIVCLATSNANAELMLEALDQL